MSQAPDPYDYPTDPPPPGEPLPDESLPDESLARQRVRVPAILLIVVGAINLLFALYQLGSLVITVVRPAEDIVEQQRQMTQMLGQVFGREIPLEEHDPEDQKKQNVILGAIFTAILLLTSLLTLVGGIRMQQLRSWGLSVMGSLMTAIPCISCMGCCGVGEIVGLWALVVLFNNEVRSTFSS